MTAVCSKVWTPDLKLIKEIDAHPVYVYALVAGDDTLYSSSDDGTIKAWNIDNLELKKVLLESSTNELIKLFFDNGKLYSGDYKGNVVVWQNDDQVERYEIGREVRELLVSGNYLLTVRNMEVSIIEMKPGEEQLFNFLQSLEGRRPLKKAGNNFCVMGREGNEINIFELSKESKFKEVGTINAHDSRVNALCVTEVPKITIFSGGYDKVVKRWDLLSKKCTGSFEVESAINTLAPGPTAVSVYVGGAVGYLVRIDFSGTCETICIIICSVGFLCLIFWVLETLFPGIIIHLSAGLGHPIRRKH